MKKIMALLLAAMTACSVGVTAFGETYTDTDNDIILGTDKNGVVAKESSVLTPGETYKFPILIKSDSGYIPLNNQTASEYSIRLESVKGKAAMDSIKIVKDKDTHYLEVAVKPTWSAKQTEIEYKLKLSKKNNSKEIMSGEILFSTGYKIASDDYIVSLQLGDYINIDPNTPIFTKSQLEKIANINGYKRVTFTDGDFTYTVNVTDKDSINMLYNNDAIKEILNAFEDHDFKFLSFPAGTQFSKGELIIDINDITEDFGGNFFTYRYYKGKLIKLDHKLDEENGLLSITTGNLGRFVISDKEIADGTIVEYGFGGVDNPDNGIEKPQAPSSPSIPSTKPNPNTGR